MTPSRDFEPLQASKSEQENGHLSEVLNRGQGINWVHSMKGFSLLLVVAISSFYLPANAQVGFRNDQTGSGTSPNGARWGGWTRPVYCPPGSWAQGYSMRVEPPKGPGDDTALNSVALYCGDRAGRPVDRIIAHEGFWGYWGEGANCAQGSFLTHFSLKVEPNQGGGGDDTAANSVRFTCNNGQVIEARGGKWGDYAGWIGGFGGSAICGLRAKVEGKQGSGDDTALNDLEFFWCTLR